MLAVALFFWLARKSWEKKVWIRTSPASFTDPGPGIRVLNELNGRFTLKIAITPAAAPQEASDIWNAVNDGKLVHVSLSAEDGALNFDISEFAVPKENRNFSIRCTTEALCRKIMGSLSLTETGDYVSNTN